jgi:hypothetical protein
VKKTTFAVVLLLFWTLPIVSCGLGPAVIDEDREGGEAAEESELEPVTNLPPAGAALPVSAFGEVWAYVVAGREQALTGGLPVSDIGYFGAEIDSYGALTDVPDRRKLPAFTGRVHLVVACNSRPLTHFILVPGSAERNALIAGLVSASRDFDGLQIDFELVPLNDGSVFISFLEELRARLGNKKFTIAMKASYKNTGDILHDYGQVAPLVDRILVMAYDEHWAASKPGPVASLAWCKRVAEYALGITGREKLIMGIPFYGRAWGSPNPSRALIYSAVESLINENQITGIRRESGIPVFDYDVPVSVKVYYEDDYSLAARMDMYKSLGVASIGFWRLGQETPAVWDLIRLEQ